MQTLWKRRDVANLVVITALVILAICRNLTTFERKGAGPELYHKFMSTHIADAAKLAKKLDTLTTIVTFCSDDFGEALLGAFIGYECRAKQMQSSVKLVHHATLANPFQSQSFFWSNIDVMLTLMQDGAGPLYHAHTILTTYPNAVVYHRSQPLIRHSDSDDASSTSQPPQFMASQYACKIDACRRLYTRHQEAAVNDHLTASSDLHAQRCLEDPDACVLLHNPSDDDTGTPINLWRLLSKPSRAPAFWKELAVCTLIRDKNEYLPEWIEFHRIQGFDHFVIYDDASRNPSLFLDSYIEDGIVTLVDWSGSCQKLTRSTEPHGFVACQRAAFVDCQNRIASRWLGIFDVDEFIFAPAITSGTVLSALQEQSDDVAGIRFVGAVFGNGNRWSSAEECLRRVLTDFIPILRTYHTRSRRMELKNQKQALLELYSLVCSVNIIIKDLQGNAAT